MNKEKIKCYLQYTMSLIGGYVGAYSLLAHHELFGNAQTANMMHIAMNIVGHNFGEMALRLLGVFVYMAGFACTVLISRYTKLNVEMCSIVLDFAGIVSLCIIPDTVNHFIALCPIFFITSFQWNSFKGADGFVSSSIFSTNNLRQFTTAITEYYCDRDKDHLRKTKFYGSVLLAYHIGVAGSYFMYKSFGNHGVLLGVVPVMAAMVIYYYSVRSEDLNILQAVKK